MRRFLVNILLLTTLVIQSSTYANDQFAARPDVQTFIQHMVKQYKFNEKELNALFAQVKIRPQIMRHMNSPLEKETWHTYQRLFVSEWHIKHGVNFWNKYADALRRAEQTYGVPASIIVATIGVETKYGQRTGGYLVIDSLSNIAFSNSKRAAYFRKELEEFLLLTREQHLNPMKVTGSYAGAIGQPQFMPSSYRYYAVNFSKSGSTDLMNNEVDVIGSIANYYSKHGWTTNQPIAMQAGILGDRYNYLLRNNKVDKRLSPADLEKYGIVPQYPIGMNTPRMRLIELQGHYKKEYWLGFHNFDVIKRYNASDLYAMAVFQLSDYIATVRNRLNET